MAKFALTTLDNPFSPFSQWESWLDFDTQHYNGETSRILARIVLFSDEMSEVDQDAAVEQAIDEIVSENPLLIYRKAVNNTV